MTTFPIVHRVPGRFMALPKDHVNAYVVELEKAVVVVDATLALSSAKHLREVAESFGKPIKAVLLTHGHPDHYTGLAVFPEVPRYSSQGALEFAQTEDYVKASTAQGYLGEDYTPVRLFPDRIISDGFKLDVDGTQFTFRDVGPAESPADGIWEFEKDGATHAFVGDLIAKDCHCFFRDGYARQWQKLLEQMKVDYGDQDLFYIGHGESPVGKDVIDWQIGYNQSFLDAVDCLEDKTVPVSKENQEAVLSAVRRFLPNDATLFLLEYEPAQTIALYFPNRGFGQGAGKEFYKEQLALMASGKIGELLLTHYHPDAVMVTFDGIRRGREELEKYYVDTLKLMRNITFLETEYFVETEDVVAFKAVIVSDGRGKVYADNGLFFRDGKIYRHIALTLLPDQDYEKLGTLYKD